MGFQKNFWGARPPWPPLDPPLVHGNLRYQHNLVELSQKVKVINFDWAENVGEAKHPMFLNHGEIQWPNSAEKGQPIQFEHDEKWINIILQCHEKLSIIKGHKCCLATH